MPFGQGQVERLCRLSDSVLFPNLSYPHNFFMGVIKGRSAIRMFNKFKEFKQKPYWGNSFWSRGYCVDTVGLDRDMIRKYVKHQDDK